ncbi:sensor histidine kinase [Paenibacillus sp. 481]|uniref:sensor histidine kinase n=1 Tax=Paenibacillus sp. 481 TaxID=2835869 RepID=UPI001E31F3F9|nr:HAMP domain-containing sensor histidine kinase [Paenibacillus sp. 481]UHA73602.1 HAMP domain-containing histidine kinase [Paenibacillus sp. 481]
MIKPGIRRSVVMHYFIVVFLTMLLLEIIFMIAVRTYYYSSVSNYITDQAKMQTAYYKQYGSVPQTEDLGALYDLKNALMVDKTEMQILNYKGEVLAGSSRFNYNNVIKTSDVTEALNGFTENWVGKQPTTGELVMSVSTPLELRGEVTYVLRYITSLEKINDRINSIVLLSVAAMIVVLVIVLIVSLGLANSIVRPINEITAASAQMARGRFDVRVKEGYKYELGELGRTLNFMAHEIVRSNQLKNDFISSISHELRTPLTGIKGWSETLLSGSMQDVEETKLGLNIITKETDRLISLVEELLDFSKLQEKRVQLHKNPLSIQELLQMTLLQVRYKAEQKQIKLQLAMSGEEKYVLADTNRLKQVFLNLLDNSIKFSPEQSAITAQIVWDDDTCCVRIIDHGIGISQEHLARVADKFYQVNPTHGGTGLGLAITYELVALHGGEMSIESEHGKGTTVIVKLPIHAADDEQPQLAGDNHLVE